MVMLFRAALVGCVLGLVSAALAGQAPAPVPSPTPVDQPPPPPRDAVAARIDGQSIPEMAVYRSLLRVPPDHREFARKEVLNYLIDNTIIDQYLLLLKIQVEPKEVQEYITKIKAEAARDKEDFNTMLKRLMISEDELRSELVSALRWDKFVMQQGSEPKLRDMFEKNPAMFNGSRVHARHILIPIENGQKDAALAKIVAIKKGIDGQVMQAVAQLPASLDAISREKERARLLTKAFADAAQAYSTCPSKKDGGDLGEFPRVGAMVEPFARAAFALKPFQMSDPVGTDFGYHLILTIDFKPGKTVKYEDVKSSVQDVYAERLREAVLNAYKGQKRIEIVERKK